MVSFAEVNTAGEWQIEVREGERVAGYIRRDEQEDVYGYYSGSDNHLTASIKDDSLDNLKRKIESEVIQDPLQAEGIGRT